MSSNPPHVILHRRHNPIPLTPPLIHRLQRTTLNKSKSQRHNKNQESILSPTSNLIRRGGRYRKCFAHLDLRYARNIRPAAQPSPTVIVRHITLHIIRHEPQYMGFSVIPVPSQHDLSGFAGRSRQCGVYTSKWWVWLGSNSPTSLN